MRFSALAFVLVATNALVQAVSPNVATDAPAASGNALKSIGNTILKNINEGIQHAAAGVSDLPVLGKVVKGVTGQSSVGDEGIVGPSGSMTAPSPSMTDSATSASPAASGPVASASILPIEPPAPTVAPAAPTSVIAIPTTAVAQPVVDGGATNQMPTSNFPSGNKQQPNMVDQPEVMIMPTGPPVLNTAISGSPSQAEMSGNEPKRSNQSSNTVTMNSKPVQKGSSAQEVQANVGKSSAGGDMQQGGFPAVAIVAIVLVVLIGASIAYFWHRNIKSATRNRLRSDGMSKMQDRDDMERIDDIESVIGSRNRVIF
ncbi:hypothetical protein BC830DRAFT_1109953 [Chytriomyces sp. MP71]|nr:hypothetical protein BC830DRAFT_1109953 [Chytriomyces sp. MP71]